MSQLLKEYLLSVTAACFLLAVVMAVVKQGTIRKLAGILGGLLIILTAISPLLKIDSDAVAEAIWKLELDSESISSGIELGSRTLLCQVISEKCSTYILDKASSLGLEVQVEVRLEESAEVPYPTEVTLRGTWSPAQQRILSDYICEELGVPAERQEWLSM